MSNTNPVPKHVEIPLFPLNTVLFPGGRMPMRIFEPRYVGMVTRCLKKSEGFGIVLIRSGSDSRVVDKQQPDIFDIGTYAEIIDFNALDDGLLGIIAKGSHKLQVLRTYEADDHLLMCEAEIFPDEPQTALDPNHQSMVDILRELVKHPMVIKLHKQMHMDIDFEDAVSVSLRLSELLPLDPLSKQKLLALDQPNQRLLEIARMLEELN
ncbi:MAG: LON peptidase substrate-binding domain-containing protein [Pseudomonadales bacterium]|nr:LON peptidase substrate-binding domain-containing protein [Pseudomonadales bacterium]